ncbi:MAG: hypothetical protein C4K60_15115 [Ideonella sp. MAG2]|nr:MAG: hypothetical protein C4K60_15115 [Ideonella sp. MAG2]
MVGSAGRWAVNWHHAVASVQPVSAIRSPALAELLRQPPEVGEMVHIQAQVRCAEKPDPNTNSEVAWRLLDCKQRIWSDAGQALTLHLSEPVEPQLQADVMEPLGHRWPGVEVPPQPAHSVGFIGQVTRIERAAGQTVALHIDTRALPSNSGGRRIAVLSTVLAAALALLHGGLGLFASLARRRR